MLRRKLLIRIGLLVACFVAGAAVAIYLLQATVPDMDRINRDAITLIDGLQTAEDCIAQIESTREGLPSAASQSAISPETTLVKALDAVGHHAAITGVGGAMTKASTSSSSRTEAYARVRELLPTFLEPAGLTQAQTQSQHASMQTALRDLARSLRAYVAEEQASFSTYLRALVLGLTLAALIMVNVAVFVLLRTAQVVLKPVGELVQGSRELAAERFDHRVHVEQQDEFGELARAYNRLAEQLQANEERKAETLRQLAVTLNHDLNNLLATIEMQLSLLDRQSGREAGLAKYFRDIQSTLSRMSVRIASLKHIRRVVLTDYVDGQKMVDLEQSVTLPPSSAPSQSPSGSAASVFSASTSASPTPTTHPASKAG